MLAISYSMSIESWNKKRGADLAVDSSDLNGSFNATEARATDRENIDASVTSRRMTVMVVGIETVSPFDIRSGHKEETSRGSR